MTLVAAGLSNDLIGRRMHLSPATVRHYLTRLYSRLGVSNRAELVARSINAQLVSVASWPPQPTGRTCIRLTVLTQHDGIQVQETG